VLLLGITDIYSREVVIFSSVFRAIDRNFWLYLSGLIFSIPFFAFDTDKMLDMIDGVLQIHPFLGSYVHLWLLCILSVYFLSVTLILRRSYYLLWLQCLLLSVALVALTAFVIFIPFSLIVMTSPHLANVLASTPLFYYIVGLVPLVVLGSVFLALTVELPQGCSIQFNTPQGLRLIREELARKSRRWVEGYVSMAEIDGIALGVSDWVLLTGRPGIGKTKALSKILVQQKKRLVVVLVDITFEASQLPLLLSFLSTRKRNLVVWDDIHRSPNLFRAFLEKIRSIPNCETSVLASLRSTERWKIPPEVMSQFYEGSVIGLKFEKKQIRQLIGLISSEWKIDITKNVEDKLVEKVWQYDPTPLYVASGLLEFEGRHLRIQDIVRFPTNTVEIWKNYFRVLTENEKNVVRSLRLASIGNVHLSRNFVSTLYLHVFYGDKGGYIGAVEGLVDKSWIEVVGDRYHAHSVPLEASTTELTDPSIKANLVKFLHEIGNVGIDLKDQMAFLKGFAPVFHDRFLLVESLAYFRELLGHYQELNDAHGVAWTLGNLGLVYVDKGEWDKAIEHYEKSLETFEKLGDVHGMAQTYNNLGSVYARKGEWD